MATILITGATDGIGLETAVRLAGAGHDLLLHGRSATKLVAARARVVGVGGAAETFLADLADPAAVALLGDQVLAARSGLDVLINNAGVLRTPAPITPDGQDVRFMVNTIAPWILTRRLLPAMGPGGRVVNLSSAAQAPVDMAALAGTQRLGEMAAYSQSKLALTMWSRALAEELGPDGPAIIAVNPGSLLASKMVKEGFGIAGNDIGIGADILIAAATGADFANASGRYFDNDSGAFADPHPAGLDPEATRALMAALEARLP